MTTIHPIRNLNSHCDKCAVRFNIGVNLILLAAIVAGIWGPFHVILYAVSVLIWSSLVWRLRGYVRREDQTDSNEMSPVLLALFELSAAVLLVWSGWYLTSLAQVIAAGIKALSARHQRQHKKNEPVGAEAQNGSAQESKLQRAIRLQGTDPVGAFRMFQGLVDQGSAEAMLQLALCFDAGRGTEPDMQQAEQWYLRAYDTVEHSLKGMVSFYLGDHYARSEQLDPARSTWMLGTSHHYAPAIYYLAGMYEQGIGVNKDVARARDLYAQAADMGHVYAKAALGRIYASGQFGLWKRWHGLRLVYGASRELMKFFDLDPDYEQHSDAEAYERSITMVKPLHR